MNPTKNRRALPSGRSGDSPVVRWFLIGLALLFLAVFLVVPLVAVFAEAFTKGWHTYAAAISDGEALSAVRLTLIAVSIAVPLNLVFGLAAAWAVSKFRFVGKNLLVTLIDLPLAVSPVIAGLVFVLLFGLHGWLGRFLDDRNIRIIFAVPGIVLATILSPSPLWRVS